MTKKAYWFSYDLGEVCIFTFNTKDFIDICPYNKLSFLPL